MLKIQEIREIIKLIDQSNIDEFTFEHDGSKIKMKKVVHASPAPVQAVPTTVVTETPAVQPSTPVAPAAVETKVAPKEEVKVAAVNDPSLHKITSPMVGTFYASPSPDADAYVKVGDKVSESSVVCIVEAMKLFNEIEAEVKGEVVEVLVENGQLVEYGQPLFLVRLS